MGARGVGEGVEGVGVADEVVGGVEGVAEVAGEAAEGSTTGTGGAFGSGRGSGVMALRSSAEGAAPGGRKVGLRFMAAASSSAASTARRAFSTGST